jgi:hypothetical protein
VTDRRRRVRAQLVLQVHQPLRVMLQVAVCGMTPARIQESRKVSCDAEPLDATEVPMPGSGRFLSSTRGRAPSRWTRGNHPRRGEQPRRDRHRARHIQARIGSLFGVDR